MKELRDLSNLTQGGEPRISDYEIILACPYPGVPREGVRVHLSHSFDAVQSETLNFKERESSLNL